MVQAKINVRKPLSFLYIDFGRNDFSLEPLSQGFPVTLSDIIPRQLSTNN